MNGSSILKKWIHHILVGVVITSFIGFYIPKALFLSGFIIALDFFKLSYSETDDKDYKSDLLYFLSMGMICGLTIIFLWAICNFAPNIQACSKDNFRAIIFAVISFPSFMGIFLWVTTRLPKIFRMIFRK